MATALCRPGERLALGNSADQRASLFRLLEPATGKIEAREPGLHLFPEMFVEPTIYKRVVARAANGDPMAGKESHSVVLKHLWFGV